MANEGPSLEVTRLERWADRLRWFLVRLRRRLPYLVWHDEEVDVTVTLMTDKLAPVEINDLSAAFRQLNSGAFAEIERTFREMGITFDKGMGCEGRDWEWDWSLQGPISVQFRGRARNPHLRRERSVPRLVASNPKGAA